MKFKILATAIMFAATAVHAEVRFSKDPKPSESRIQNTRGTSYLETPMYDVPNKIVRSAPIVNVETMSKLETGVTQRQICGVSSVPIHRNVAITEPIHNSGTAAFGAIIGAVIGHSISNGNSGATLIGGAIGAGAGSQSGHRVVGHTTQIVGYQQQNTCQIIEEPYSRNIIVGYLVTYDDNGERKTISTTMHPGTHVRLVTTTKTEL